MWPGPEKRGFGVSKSEVKSDPTGLGLRVYKGFRV